ncbi:MAG: arginine--tRNA ligase [Acidiferrobacterales bacterium]|nr:arginine--tRNA ligase [Acidiferrobacterales bacterium]
MKEQLHSLFDQALEQLKSDGIIPAEHQVHLKFEHTRQKEHGDFATNVAMTLAKPAASNPRELAEKIVAALPRDELITKVDIAGPGFINIFVAQNAHFAVLDSIFTESDQYGLAQANSKSKILVEFVSANPTGPLHVGHGRGAAYGDALVRVLRAAGNTVESEYYVNDAGRQMDILAISVWLRYLQENAQQVAFPDNCYKGDYVLEMAKSIAAECADNYVVEAVEIGNAIDSLEQEEALDVIIKLAKQTLGQEGFTVFFSKALDTIIADIREDLIEFGVNYETWYSERSLFDSGKIDAVIEKLKTSKYLYEKGGAWWFKSTDFGDEKDRVVVRDNGQPTYFASDIAYHQDKLDRGFDQCINIWGSDHHGYIPRVNAAMQALGLDQDKLTVLLVQFAVLYRGGEKISMSTRSGDFVTLRELRDEVGADAARFFYVQRKSEQHMDFDLDLAKSQSNENPVYYVQYAHARICSIFNQARERNIEIGDPSKSDFSLLDKDSEAALLTLLQRFPEVIQNAARDYEPHQLTYYLRDLATAFHSYYNNVKFLDAQEPQRQAMLALCAAVQQVLLNGLSIVGVTAPEKM